MVAAGGVHRQVVYIANLLWDSTHLVLFGSNVCYQSVDLLQVAESEFVKGTETTVLVRQRVVLHPTATSVLVEIVLCHGGRVEVFEMNACGLRLITCS